jgi:hypothetical protein
MHTHSYITGHGHTVLVLDEKVQHIPWESFPCLKGTSMSRMPSAAMILGALSARGKALFVQVIHA